jgi:hypothetical protein
MTRSAISGWKTTYLAVLAQNDVQLPYNRVSNFLTSLSIEIWKVSQILSSVVTVMGRSASICRQRLIVTSRNNPIDNIHSGVYPSGG